MRRSTRLARAVAKLASISACARASASRMRGVYVTAASAARSSAYASASSARTVQASSRDPGMRWSQRSLSSAMATSRASASKCGRRRPSARRRPARYS
jgi:hypothetical protein